MIPYKLNFNTKIGIKAHVINSGLITEPSPYFAQSQDGYFLFPVGYN